MIIIKMIFVTTKMSKRQMLKHYKIVKNELKSSQNMIEQLNEKIERLEQTQQNYQEEDFDWSYQEESDGSENSEQHEQIEQNYQEDSKEHSDWSYHEESDGSENSKQHDHEDSSDSGNENSKEYDHDLDNSNEECEHCENMKKLLNKAKTMQTNHSDKFEKVTSIFDSFQKPIESYSKEMLSLERKNLYLELKTEILHNNIEQKEKEIAKINKIYNDDIEEMKKKYKIYSNDEI